MRLEEKFKEEIYGGQAAEPRTLILHSTSKSREEVYSCAASRPHVSTFLKKSHYSPPHKIRGLYKMLEQHHLLDFYREDGPSMRAAYHPNGRSLGKVVSEVNSYFKKEKMSLMAVVVPESEMVEISSIDGPGFDIIRALRTAYPKIFGG